MGMDWFDRISTELQDHLESICEKYNKVGHMSIERGSKHPRIEFFVEVASEISEEEREYFCTLCFDPYNVEFYIESFDMEYELVSRTILIDIEEIIDAVHESFHQYLNEDEVDEQEDDIYVNEGDDQESIFEEIDVEWETPEVPAFIHEDEVEITYQFGIVTETGDGVLRRINRINTEENELIKDETNFIFSKEEASTIIAMIASHMDSLSEFDFQ